MPLRRPRTVSEALKAPKHEHQWKDWKDGLRFCTVCGFPIVRASAEASSDCNHSWTQMNLAARCEKCDYVARGDDYRPWFRKYSKWEQKYRPRCLVCREPVMKEASICEVCTLTVPDVVL